MGCGEVAQYVVPKVPPRLGMCTSRVGQAVPANGPRVGTREGRVRAAVAFRQDSARGGRGLVDTIKAEYLITGSLDGPISEHARPPRPPRTHTCVHTRARTVQPLPAVCTNTGAIFPNKPQRSGNLMNGHAPTLLAVAHSNKHTRRRGKARRS